ncbi:paired amphipathic helix protein Sin3b [Sarotherodon galilaeus]
MEHERCRRLGKRCVILIVFFVVLIVIVAVVLGLTLCQNKCEFESTFLSRCEKFNEYDCKKVWGAFQQAYVNKNSCKVPVEAYDPLIAAAPFKPQCNKTMFWSKTKDVVHGLTAKRNDCFVTLEDTLLGSVLDGLTWCGKEGSKDVACGDVTAMLSGSIDEPFDSTSNFASVEVPRFKAPRVKKLNVVMVIQNNAISNCTDPSLKNLTQALDKGITYSCKDVPESQIQECGAKPEIACGACW